MRRIDDFLENHYWVSTVAIFGGAVSLGIGAWNGERWGIVALVFFNCAIALLLFFNRNLLKDSLEGWRRSSVAWREESDFSQAVTDDYVKMLSRLYELDPTAAEVFQDRLAEALTSRHPEIALAAAERASKAGMN